MLIAAVLTFLFTLTPTHMLAQENIVDRLDKELGITLPKEYQNVVKMFVDTSQVFNYDKNSDAADFTANFIKHKMKYNWNINKQNQLLFIWHSIYQQCTNKDLYDGEDGNDKRLEECEEAIDSIDLCGLTYKNEFVAHMNKLTAKYRQQSAESQKRINEAKRQSAESQKRIDEAQKRIDAAQKRIDEAIKQSAEARQQSAEMIQEIIKKGNETLAIYKEFYPFFKEHPEDENLKKFKSNAQKLILLCKEFGVDYKAVLSAEILKFYGVE